MITTATGRWLNAYNSVVYENGPFETSTIQLIACHMACQQESLTLDEYVACAKKIELPLQTAFYPTLLKTLSDWNPGLTMLLKVTRIEPKSIERLVTACIQERGILDSKTIEAFASTVEDWGQSKNKELWYSKLPESKNLEIAETILKQRITAVGYETLSFVSAHISKGSETYWKDLRALILSNQYHISDSTMQKIGNYYLNFCPKDNAADMLDFIKCYYKKKAPHFPREIPDESFADWVRNVMDNHTVAKEFLMRDVCSKNPYLLLCRSLKEHTDIMEYFLNTPPAKEAENALRAVRKVCEALMDGNPGTILAERAWLKKLDYGGAQAHDIKKMDQWTPRMMQMFNYWMASTHLMNKHHSPSTGHVHIKKNIACEFQKRTGLDLRNPAQFEVWKTNVEKDSDPFQAASVLNDLSTHWRDACLVYLGTMPCVAQVQALQGIDFNL